MKFKKGDKILCIRTPDGSLSPNIKKGMTGIVINMEEDLAIQIIGKRGPIKKFYALHEDDQDCYRKIREDSIDDIIEREILALGGA